MEVQRRALKKNGRNDVLWNLLLEAVVNNLSMINAEREGNEAGGMQVTFPNPRDGWIPGLRWREMSLEKDHLEEITEAGSRASIT